MSKYWSKLVHTLDPYVPGEQPQDKSYIKLNTNENPYPPSEAVIEAMKEASNENVRLYPDPTVKKLTDELASYYKVKPEQIFIGNGSDEVLAFSFQAFFDQGKPILFPDITYSFYPVYCGLYNLEFKRVPLLDDFSISTHAYQIENGGIIFPNPNAPTGRFLALDQIRNLIEQNQESVVIVDEAYVDFGGESALSLVEEFPNLLVIQTFSKSRSLAGMRIGFAIGNEELIEGLNRIKNSFNSYTIDRIAIAAGMASLQDDDYFKATNKKIEQTREDVTRELIDLGFMVVPSKANFIFASHPEQDAKVLYETLKGMGILVRYFQKDRIDQFIRITIGTDEEMKAFIDGMGKIIQGK